jgi:hypothetical protein
VPPSALCSSAVGVVAPLAGGFLFDGAMDASLVATAVPLRSASDLC